MKGGEWCQHPKMELEEMQKKGRKYVNFVMYLAAQIRQSLKIISNSICKEERGRDCDCELVNIGEYICECATLHYVNLNIDQF
jgi:hypothetical protein